MEWCSVPESALMTSVYVPGDVPGVGAGGGVGAGALLLPPPQPVHRIIAIKSVNDVALRLRGLTRSIAPATGSNSA